ncbi:helix-turn-helix transcriptional regulator [Streptococcus sp. FSL R7-0212]|uniref:helix-turn-helix domain-containing protein n=1 Tax=Streptococcus sp. FSL R7-0212 TaxID=2921726 RepID=UPI0030F9B655
MTLDKLVAKRINLLRKELNLTQEQLAEQSEIDVSSIAKIERGERSNITLNTFEKVVNGLGISYESFFNFDNTLNNHVSADKLLNNFSELPLHKQNKYLEIFNSILDLNEK